MRLRHQPSWIASVAADPLVGFQFSSVAQSCPTLCDPMNWLGLGVSCCCLVPKSCLNSFVTPWIVVCQSFLSTGFSRQEYWSGLPFPPPGHLPNPEIKPAPPALTGVLFTTEPPGKPLGVSTCCIIKDTSSLCPGILAQSF